MTLTLQLFVFMGFGMVLMLFSASCIIKDVAIFSHPGSTLPRRCLRVQRIKVVDAEGVKSWLGILKCVDWDIFQKQGMKLVFFWGCMEDIHVNFPGC